MQREIALASWDGSEAASLETDEIDDESLCGSWIGNSPDWHRYFAAYATFGRNAALPLKETAMRHVSYIVAIATLAGAVAGCADPYYPRSGYSQSYYQQPSYSYYSPGYAYR